MQQESSIDTVLTVSHTTIKRLLLRSRQTEIACANPVCFNFFTPSLRQLKKPTGSRLYCSSGCALRACVYSQHEKGGIVRGERLRGINPNKHIRKRVRTLDGRTRVMYLHRWIVETEDGITLESTDVVHHRDRDKHHNCYKLNLCEQCKINGYGNLELMTGDAAAEHIRYHQIEMQRARRKRK